MSNVSRRKLLKSITLGSGTLLAGSSLPEHWTKPVVNTVLLPAHAQTTDDSDSLPGFTPLDYFGEDLPRDRTDAMLERDKQTLFADALDAVIPQAHAYDCGPETLPGISVASDGVNAIVKFLSSKSHKLYQASVPLDGTPSGEPALINSCKAKLNGGSSGPQSVQILGYVEGATSVRVRVNARNSVGKGDGYVVDEICEEGQGQGWEVSVPQGTIQDLNLDCF